MAGATIQGSRKVGRIGLGIHANRCRTIMAGRAVINDASMIEDGPDKRTGVMADATVLVCWHMSAGFTYGERAIMTGATVVHDTYMVKGGRYKPSGLVAITAVTSGWHMVRWRGFTWGGCTIVA